MNTAVLLLIFNRPHLVQRVFDAIRKAKPLKLFVMADGPRTGNPQDIQKCNAARMIINQVDWECEVKTLFFDENHGCGRAVMEGLNWFFNNVEQGIILEDDCLPDESFFLFCDDLLNYYKNDPRVMHINGNNFNTKTFTPSSASYHFGSYPQAWGWASWRRAWKYFDFDIAKWPEIKKKKLLTNMNWSWYERFIQKKKYNDQYNSNRHDIWDYQWHLAVFSNNGLTIVPKINLISNIGFGKDATHTKEYRKSCTEIETGTIKFPLQHPVKLIADKNVDDVYSKIIVGTPATFIFILRNQIRNYLRKQK